MVFLSRPVLMLGGVVASHNVVGSFFFVLGAINGIVAVLRYFSSEFAVTDKRVIIKVGVLRRRSLELLRSKIEGIAVDQSLLGRMLGYGNIAVTGTGGSNERFKNVTGPFEFRRAVQGAVA